MSPAMPMNHMNAMTAERNFLLLACFGDIKLFTQGKSPSIARSAAHVLLKKGT